MKIFKKIFLFILILILLDWSIGKVLNHYYFNIHSGDIGSMTYVIETMETNIVIIGASGAKHDYIPSIFNKKLNLSCFNAGRGGTGLLYYNVILEAVFERYKPKLIILDLSPYAFDKNLDDNGRISAILPYYSKNIGIKQYINQRSRFENIKMISKIYPYNSLLLKIINSIFKTNDEIDFLKFNGYQPLNNILKVQDVPKQKDNEIDFDENKIKLFKKFIIKAQSASNTKLVVVSSPYFGTNKTLPIGNKLIEDICKKYNIKFLYFSDDSLFESHPEYFHNISHLNQKGAIVYSTQLSEALAKLRFGK